MRLLAELPPDRAARATDVLVAAGLSAQLREETHEEGGEPTAAVWIEEEDDVAPAREALAAFLAEPDAPRYAAASQEADRRRAGEAKEKRAAAKRFRRGRDAFRDAAAGVPFWRRAPVCTALIAACVVTGLFGWGGAEDPWSLWARQEPLIRWLWIAPTVVVNGQAGWVPSDDLMPTLASGQVWRLVTPMLLHANPIHLAFNMSWLISLGAAIEARFGGRRFLLGVLAVAALSNVAEFFLDMHLGEPFLGLFDWDPNPWFGGFSGVAVGLFGFALGRARGGAPVVGLSQQGTFIMLGFLVLCVVDDFIAVANVAHFVGLGVGFAGGYLSARREG